MELSSLSSKSKTFYKLEINGIVYLAEPSTAIAYTYDMKDPVAIGKISWLTQHPQIELFDGWKDILQAKLDRDSEIPTLQDETTGH